MSATTSFLTEDMRQQAIGVESAPSTTEVEMGAIRKFAEAIEDTNPLWNNEWEARHTRHGGLVTPPTFLRSMKTLRAELPFEMPFDRVLDGGSEWEYFEAVLPGDHITTIDRVEDMREHTGRMGLMVITTAKITYRNQFDAVVATQTSTVIHY